MLRYGLNFGTKCLYRVFQMVLPTDSPVGVVIVQFPSSDVVPDAGEPVREDGKHGHQQRQYDDAVLVVAIQLLEQPGKTEKTSDLEEVYNRTL